MVPKDLIGADKVGKEGDMAWTLFWDMHSGGGQKEKWSKIYIEASKEEAKVIFYNRFGHNPERVTCTCCGGDYVIDEDPTLEEASAFHRNCQWIQKEGTKGMGPDGRYLEVGEDLPGGWAIGHSGFHGDEPQTLTEYRKSKDVLIIPASKIKPKERVGEVPEQGYVWVD